jgi:hypothetical protein
MGVDMLSIGGELFCWTRLVIVRYVPHFLQNTVFVLSWAE